MGQVADHTERRGIDVRARNSRLNRDEAAARAITLESRPQMLFLELTRACNLACPMCRDEVLSGRHLAMSAEVLARVEAELFPYVDVVDLRGFGESTLDGRLLPLVDQLNTSGTWTKVLTNLSLHSPSYWGEVGSKEFLVGISLEAASPGAYERTRKGARFDRFLANLHALRRAQIARGGTDDIYFNVVVSDENICELVGLVELAGRASVPLITLNPIAQGTEDDTYPGIGVRPSNVKPLRDALEEARQCAAVNGVELRLGANLATGCTTLGGFGQCLHPWSYVYVRYDGGIGFCDHLLTQEDAIFGNILETSFMDVWNGASYTQMRQEHVDRDFERLHRQGIECDWCYKNRYTDCEDMVGSDERFMTIDSRELVDALLDPDMSRGAEHLIEIRPRHG